MMRKALVRKGFAFAMLLAFVLAMGAWSDVARAADMPSGPEKFLAGGVQGFARLLATPILVLKEATNLRKNGLLAPFKAIPAGVVDEVTNVPRTVATIVTWGNNINYNAPVGQLSPEAQKVATAVPNLGAPY